MKVFVSWSGNTAKGVAEFLREWLPLVLAGTVTVFVSSKDIDKGDRPLDAIATELGGAGLGIVVLTPESQDSQWVNFEVGALGGTLGQRLVAPLLVGLREADVVGPLTQFQMTDASRPDDVWALVTTIAGQTGSAVPEGSLRVLFDSQWPSLEQAIEGALRSGDVSAPEPRKDRDVLEEILERVRSLSARVPVEVSRTVAAQVLRDFERDRIGDHQRIVSLTRHLIPEASLISIPRDILGHNYISLQLVRDVMDAPEDRVEALSAAVGMPVEVTIDPGSTAPSVTVFRTGFAEETPEGDADGSVKSPSEAPEGAN